MSSLAISSTEAGYYILSEMIKGFCLNLHLELIELAAVGDQLWSLW